jgi:hypothetical protein
VAEAAPRIDDRLLAALARLDKRGRPIAETHRRLGRVADTLELTRPSYEQVRVHVHALRRRELNPGAGDILLDIAFQRRTGEALRDLLA